eukprot:6203375-Pleurochrysis_carterae.AAC.4
MLTWSRPRHAACHVASALAWVAEAELARLAGSSSSAWPPWGEGELVGLRLSAAAARAPGCATASALRSCT